MTKIELSKYQTLIFDCDGVLLNSNKIKTEAFYEVTKPYGDEAAQTLKNYHILNGGVSRYQKFDFFFKDILKKPVLKGELNELLTNYAETVKSELLVCEIAKNIKELRNKTKLSNWLIVSGGDQNELREVFKIRGLAHYFDGGIFGSPDNKNAILKTEQKNGNIACKSLFIGDSLYDYQAALKAKIDFIFLSKWTELADWGNIFTDDQVYSDLSALLD